ncbi:MAG: hypothetical protein EZS28_027957 [Streblomastix strix]|uniref:Uncharacterized protein n=1 Tax=Streblomastix strix TaxID=222440 RepID=A0A5J4V0L0_9EUKA|nr:MAG: hypothetical protein EZS28_027957 [Streblomastix strix]
MEKDQNVKEQDRNQKFDVSLKMQGEKVQSLSNIHVEMSMTAGSNNQEDLDNEEEFSGSNYLLSEPSKTSRSDEEPRQDLNIKRSKPDESEQIAENSSSLRKTSDYQNCDNSSLRSRRQNLQNQSNVEDDLYSYQIRTNKNNDHNDNSTNNLIINQSNANQNNMAIRIEMKGGQKSSNHSALNLISQKQKAQGAQQQNHTKEKAYVQAHTFMFEVIQNEEQPTGQWVLMRWVHHCKLDIHATHFAKVMDQNVIGKISIAPIRVTVICSVCNSNNNNLFQSSPSISIKSLDAVSNQIKSEESKQSASTDEIIHKEQNLQQMDLNVESKDLHKSSLTEAEITSPPYSPQNEEIQDGLNSQQRVDLFFPNFELSPISIYDSNNNQNNPRDQINNDNVELQIVQAKDQIIPQARVESQLYRLDSEIEVPEQSSSRVATQQRTVTYSKNPFSLKNPKKYIQQQLPFAKTIQQICSSSSTTYCTHQENQNQDIYITPQDHKSSISISNTEEQIPIRWIHIQVQTLMAALRLAATGNLTPLTAQQIPLVHEKCTFGQIAEIILEQFRPNNRFFTVNWLVEQNEESIKSQMLQTGLFQQCSNILQTKWGVLKLQKIKQDLQILSTLLRSDIAGINPKKESSQRATLANFEFNGLRPLNSKFANVALQWGLIPGVHSALLFDPQVIATTINNIRALAQVMGLQEILVAIGLSETRVAETVIGQKFTHEEIRNNLSFIQFLSTQQLCNLLGSNAILLNQPYRYIRLIDLTLPLRNEMWAPQNFEEQIPLDIMKEIYTRKNSPQNSYCLNSLLFERCAILQSQTEQIVQARLKIINRCQIAQKGKFTHIQVDPMPFEWFEARNEEDTLDSRLRKSTEMKSKGLEYEQLMRNTVEQNLMQEKSQKNIKEFNEVSKGYIRYAIEWDKYVFPGVYSTRLVYLFLHGKEFEIIDKLKRHDTSLSDIKKINELNSASLDQIEPKDQFGSGIR